MILFGLIGYPLTHSFSEKYFSEKFKREKITNCRFVNFPIKNINQFPALLQQNPALRGLSVTIPYKESIIRFLDILDESAKAVGAVNCIKRCTPETGNQKLYGFNTDIFGFEKSLQPLLKPHHRQALVLGTGGAAKAVKFVLKKLGINYLSVSRKPKEENNISYEQLGKKIIDEHTLIINTTPVGMFPETNVCPPLPYSEISPQHLLYDLIYNPEETLFLKKGKKQGAQIKNGMEMLRLQAEKAWEIWNTA